MGLKKSTWLIWIGILLLAMFNLKLTLIGIVAALLFKWFRKRFKKRELGEGEFGPVRKIVKDAILARQKGFCGKGRCKETKHLELHHRVPKHLGGDNRISNLVYLCPNHHAEAHENRKGKVDYKAVPKYLFGGFRK